MQEGEKLSLEQIRAFLGASDAVLFQAAHRSELYGWVNRTLREQNYEQLPRAGKGLVRAYVGKMTGLSRAQVTRLISVYLEGEPVELRKYRRHRFPSRYTRADSELLAAVDEAHGTLSGPATRRILEREYGVFGDARYQRLAGISSAHIYNLRRSPAYGKRRISYQPTKATRVGIGERRAPQPNGVPGYLRVDTVHQGDREVGLGLYHINVVDEVTQWQIVGATPHISEAWLLPLLEAILEQFPFRIRGFHSDNGSEFINYTVAKLLKKLLVEQTKSRPRQSNDNGLVESKNGAVVRKHMGYLHIGAEHAPAVQRFYEKHFNPYLNLHRPCGQPEIVLSAKGKRKRVYRQYITPWEKLRSLPDVEDYLKPGISVAELDRQAGRQSDTAAAEQMQAAKRKLFESFRRRSA